MEKLERTDVTVESHGSIVLFRIHSDEAQEWVDENVDANHWLGSAFAVEPRYAQNLAAGMLSCGLTVQ